MIVANRHDRVYSKALVVPERQPTNLRQSPPIVSPFKMQNDGDCTDRLARHCGRIKPRKGTERL
jgi:hypothetical protein